MLTVRNEAEYEILDTGIFDNNEYFDITITYAKKMTLIFLFVFILPIASIKLQI